MRKTVIGLEMKESDVFKIKVGEKIKFTGKLLLIQNLGFGSFKVYLCDGVVTKQ
jgi:hypothetical protein